VTQLRRFLELELARVAVHPLLELRDAGRDLRRRELRVRLRRLLALAAAAPLRYRARSLHDVLHALHDAARLDAVRCVVLELLRAAAVRLVDRALHRARHPVGVENRLAAKVPCSSADVLDERALGSQETLIFV